MSLKLGLLLVLAFSWVACAEVRPWERDVLSRPDMAWTPDPLGAELADHIHFSKEGSLIGGGAGGGGCGCN